MTPTLRFFVAISSLCLLFICAFASSIEFLGIPPNDLSYYKSSVIKCKDGSKKFTKDRLNDDFCDCPDGTDEPGTSACPLGKFYCQNLGHIPITIFSSRVNDGLCDCCDGSDEYDGKTKCPNTCWEAGKATREKLKKKIEAHQQGLVIRKTEVDKAKEGYAKDEAELTKLKSEEKILKGLIEKLKEHKERIEKAEEEERIKKKEEQRLKEAEKNSTAEEKSPGVSSDETKDVQDIESSPSDQPVKDLDNSEHAQGHVDTVDEEPVIKQSNTIAEDSTDIGTSTGAEDSSSDQPSEQEKISDNADELSREELGRLVASRWTGENAAKSSNEADDEKEDDHGGHTSDSVDDENFDGYNSETDDDRYKYDDDFDANGEYGGHGDSHDSIDSDEDFKKEFSESTPSGGPSWLEKIQLSVQNLLQAFNFFKTPVDLSEASRVRKEYDDATSKLSKLQSRISSLSEKIKYDFGNDKEFYSFHGRCFENKQNKYVYKVCPFKSASQVEGHSSTELGRWDKFDDSYRVMQFTRGDKCWNGPDRSLKVKLRCGLKDELTDVDEPSRCEYVAILSTPLVCLEEKLKELEKKLEDLNTSQPASHDEL